MMTDAHALLVAYGTNGSEDAFRELVDRYIGLVYSTALRQVGGDTYLAEDVTQLVFADLARRAGEVSATVMLGGWLHQRAFNVARAMMRSERRRKAREQEAVEMKAMEDDSAANLARIGPVLDEIIMALKPDDRAAIILRFFERRDLRSVGEALGANEDAAQKRVSRALEKMRLSLGRGGVTLSASALGAMLAAEEVTAVPAGLAASTLPTALSAAEFLSTGASKAISMTILQKTIVGCVIAAAIGTGIYESLVASNLRRQIDSIRQQQASTIVQVQQGNGRGGSLVGESVLAQEDERQRLRKEHLELLSLRGKIKQVSDELRKLKAGASTEQVSTGSSETSDGDSILFGASLTNQVGSGQTLVVGGWQHDGMRGYILLTPIIRKNGESQYEEPLAVQSQVIGAPEAFWHQIGWGEAKSDKRRSTIAGLLNAEQTGLLLKAIEATTGGEMSNTSLANRKDGEQIGIGLSVDDECGAGSMMSLDVYPRIGDGNSVILEIAPSPPSTNSSIHPSLRPSSN